MEAFTTSGKWWLPEKPEATVAGTASFSGAEGTKLELIGKFHQMTALEIASTLSPEPAIHGITTQGKLVTLFDCHQIGSEVHFPSTEASTTYLANVMLLGGHFESRSTAQFDSLSINYFGLEGWAKLAGCTFPKDQIVDGGRRVEIEYGIPNPFTISLDTFTISFESEVQHRQNPDHLSINIEETCSVRIKPNEPKDLGYLLSHFGYHLQNFLTLAMGVPAIPMRVRLTSPDLAFQLPDEAEPRQAPIDVYYAVKGRPSSDAEPPGVRDILFYLGEVRPYLEGYLRNWFSRATNLRPIYDLFFATRIQSPMFLQPRFLSLAQAIETLHRRTMPGAYVEPAIWEATKAILVEAIPNDLSSEFRASLAQRFSYMSEYSLRKRLKDILETVSTRWEQLPDDRTVFVNNIVYTRNYLTHYDATLKDKALMGKALFGLTQQMEALLEVCLLMELGMETEHIKAVMKRRNQFRGVVPFAD